MLTFQRLDVYQCALEFLQYSRQLRGSLPRGHAELADQLRRAAQSICQNIAEGAGRGSRLEKAKHYIIARGSAMECASHLDIMKLEECIEIQAHDAGIVLVERIVAMLTKMIDA